MQTKIFLAALIISSFLVSNVSMAAESADISDAKTKTSIDHIKLAEYYENEVKALRAKMEEEKKILDEYENHSYYYGPEGQLYQSHHEALLREYEKAAERNMEMAASHRKMAERVKGAQ
ncbi:MAG: hypothetical protein H0X02_02190 [Nitrosomonas sp.]|nr:hypothetical protein [Nitrosomonas sp.]